MELKELQKQFKSHLFSQQSNIAGHIVSDNLSSEFRLSLYANGYVVRLIEVLENDYPVLKEFLGEEAFFELCRLYIARHPSKFASLRWFGQHLPAFLRGEAPYDQTPYLAELAQLEWTLVDAFNASDQVSIEEGDVARVPVEKWPELSFAFHPSVHVFSYYWNILPLWQAHKEQKPFPDVEKLPAQESCLVWRRQLNTFFRTLPKDEAELLGAACQGADFSQLCELLSEDMREIQDPQEIPMRAASLLKTWIADTIVTELRY
jgi:hypothetical protein